jgi:acetyltransferase
MERLFSPRSVAVIGASTDPEKVGYAVVKNLKESGFEGSILPVNPRLAEVLGLKTFPSLADITEKLDVAVVAIPAPLVPTVLRDCASAGVAFAVVLSAGFKEAGSEGAQLEDQMRAITKGHAMRILGPNCLGIISTPSKLNASFAAGMLPKGRIAFFSQSGALGIAILDWAVGNKVGFSRFISLGNKLDLNEIDFIEYFVSDPETDVILGYIEDVVDGRKFLDIAKKASKQKPIILIKSGGTLAGARAASSHTGALAGSETAFNAAFKQTGIIRAQGIQDLFDTALAFAGSKLPAGDRLLIVTNAGGPGILAADMAERSGIRLPQMTNETIDSIAPLLPSSASLYNPVDIIGDATSERYAAVLNSAVNDPNVDGILVILTPQAMTDVESTADIVIKASRATAKPVIASFMGEARVRESIERLKVHAIPCFSYPEIAVTAFKRLLDFNTWKHRGEEAILPHVRNKEKADTLINSILRAGRYEVGEDAAMEILSHYGFTFPEKALAHTAREASAIAERIGFPLVMKISSPDILHKTDVGGVKLNINSEMAAEDAFLEITSNVRRLMPDAFINGVMLYEMISGGKEVILGVTYDRTFGHMIMFGLGGIYVEVLKDVSFRIAPVSRREASSMINEIRTSALLKGSRGEKPVDIESIIDGIVGVSSIVTDFPVIHELDINPLVVMQKGALALDARIIFERQKSS